MSKDPLAAGVGTDILQLPESSAFVKTILFDHEGVMEIFSAGDAHPQNRASAFCCKTMLSLKMAGNFTSQMLMLMLTIKGLKIKSASYLIFYLA